MCSRPEVVDAQGGPMTGNAGGPMPLAKLKGGKVVPCRWQTT
jgi:hypothetical protein